MTTTHTDYHTAPADMPRVIVESPYNAPTYWGMIENTLYARKCVRDSLQRGEAPIASHLLYTQIGILKEEVPEERAWGIAAGLAWSSTGARHVFYVDRGWSTGMLSALEWCKANNIEWDERRLNHD